MKGVSKIINIRLLMNNESPHNAQMTDKIIKLISMLRLPHPLYSQKSPNDIFFNVFVKKQLKRFQITLLEDNI